MKAIFCDFDGTITNYDLLDIIVDVFNDTKYRTDMDTKILNNEIEHNNALEILFSKVDISFNEAINIIDKKCGIVVNSTFKNFYDDCKKNNIPVYIISGGFKTFIKYYLPYVHEQDIYANDILIEDGKWNLSFLTTKLDKKAVIETICHNKNYSNITYYGDGVSDIGVVNMDNIVLYVKKNSFLENYCNKHNINCFSFIDFDISSQ